MNELTSPLISLTTDFSTRSEAVGVMKAVILKICPEARILDVCHHIERFNLREGAWTLGAAVSYLPKGIHVGVIDPGVGTERRGIIIETKRGDFLVGPDNGILIPAAERLEGIVKAVEIKEEKYLQKPIAPSFHGRDVFASVAAYLARSVSIEKFGPELNEKELVEAPYKKGELKKGALEGEVLHIDGFGNCATNISSELLKVIDLKKGEFALIKLSRKEFKLRVLDTFGETMIGEGMLMDDTYGRIALSVNQQSAAENYSIKIGDIIRISKVEKK